MKSMESLRRRQKEMRSRHKEPKVIGRPPRIFSDRDEDLIGDLLARDYSPKAIATMLGVSLRCLGQSFPYLAPGAARSPATRQKLLLVQLAMAGDPGCLKMLARENGMRLKSIGSYGYIPQDFY